MGRANRSTVSATASRMEVKSNTTVNTVDPKAIPPTREGAISGLISEIKEQIATDTVDPGSPVENIYAHVPASSRIPIDIANKGTVIGIAGLPKNGKDVIADYLSAYYKGIERVAFSDFIIKEVNEHLADNAVDHAITPENKSVKTNRVLLQEWGMARREEYENYWTDAIDNFVKDAKDRGVDAIIVTGARMPSDFDLIEDVLGGDMWRAHRPGNDYVATHEVEIACATREVAHVIENPVEGDIRPFEDNIDDALNNYQN